MKISKTNEGYMLEKEGQQFELTWSDFWQISRLASRKDAKSEIEDFLCDIDQDCFDMNSKYSVDVILNDENIMGEIVKKLLDIRIAGESSDDVFDALENVCGVGCLTSG